MRTPIKAESFFKQTTPNYIVPTTLKKTEQVAFTDYSDTVDIAFNAIKVITGLGREAAVKGAQEAAIQGNSIEQDTLLNSLFPERKQTYYGIKAQNDANSDLVLNINDIMTSHPEYTLDQLSTAIDDTITSATAGMDPDYVNSYMQIANHYKQGALVKQQGILADYMKQESLANISGVAKQFVSTYVANIDLIPSERIATDLRTELTRLQENGKTLGLTRDDVTNEYIRVLGELAVNEGRPELLDFADVADNSGFKVSKPLTDYVNFDSQISYYASKAKNVKDELSLNELQREATLKQELYSNILGQLNLTVQSEIYKGKNATEVFNSLQTMYSNMSESISSLSPQEQSKLLEYINDVKAQAIDYENSPKDNSDVSSFINKIYTTQLSDLSPEELRNAADMLAAEFTSDPIINGLSESQKSKYAGMIAEFKQQATQAAQVKSEHDAAVASEAIKMSSLRLISDSKIKMMTANPDSETYLTDISSAFMDVLALDSAEYGTQKEQVTSLYTKLLEDYRNGAVSTVNEDLYRKSLVEINSKFRAGTLTTDDLYSAYLNNSVTKEDLNNYLQKLDAQQQQGVSLVQKQAQARLDVVQKYLSNADLSFSGVTADVLTTQIDEALTDYFGAQPEDATLQGATDVIDSTLALVGLDFKTITTVDPADVGVQAPMTRGLSGDVPVVDNRNFWDKLTGKAIADPGFTPTTTQGLDDVDALIKANPKASNRKTLIQELIRNQYTLEDATTAVDNYMIQSLASLIKGFGIFNLDTTEIYRGLLAAGYTQEELPNILIQATALATAK